MKSGGVAQASCPRRSSHPSRPRADLSPGAGAATRGVMRGVRTRGPCAVDIPTRAHLCGRAWRRLGPPVAMPAQRAIRDLQHGSSKHHSRRCGVAPVGPLTHERLPRRAPCPEYDRPPLANPRDSPTMSDRSRRTCHVPASGLAPGTRVPAGDDPFVARAARSATHITMTSLPRKQARRSPQCGMGPRSRRQDQGVRDWESM
mmetsp:Transcript_16894/g.45478  ORF Transcript_16894/g.45478 Transcript_16894/m.45478 type:complete len:202 (+) Transcript_16894:252-857(+)